MKCRVRTNDRPWWELCALTCLDRVGGRLCCDKIQDQAIVLIQSEKITDESTHRLNAAALAPLAHILVPHLIESTTQTPMS